MTTTESRRKLIAKYRNGNYGVWLYSDGTKIKRTPADFFDARFPDSIDLKITDRCDMNCPMCHESSTDSGAHGDLYAAFLETLHAGTELAIGGGNPLSHPELDAFLLRMKERRIICNLTVNEEHLLRDAARIDRLLDKQLIHGLGISIARCADETVAFAAAHKTSVLHLICGIADETLLGKLYGKSMKVLLLGYKKLGRGCAYYGSDVESRIEWLKAHIIDVAKKFDTVSFDNLAIEQLGLRESVPQALFAERYMGDDGTASMYIDLVKNRFAVSSTSTERYPVGGSVDEMFAAIKRTQCVTSH